jgi:hypothetical protein
MKLEDRYDKEGKPISLIEWGRLLEDRDYKIVKQETLESGKWVSTVWLGLDYSFGGDKPLIFETMVFPSREDFSDLDCERYSTLEEAEIGHIEMVKKWDKK